MNNHIKENDMDEENIQKKIICCICGKEIKGYGNNPEPIDTSDKKCCDDCNSNYVIPARIKLILNK